MGEFLRRLSRSLKESSQDWPQIAAQYEQGKEAQKEAKRARIMALVGLAMKGSPEAIAKVLPLLDDPELFPEGQGLFPPEEGSPTPATQGLSRLGAPAPPQAAPMPQIASPRLEDAQIDPGASSDFNRAPGMAPSTPAPSAALSRIAPQIQPPTGMPSRADILTPDWTPVPSTIPPGLDTPFPTERPFTRTGNKFVDSLAEGAATRELTEKQKQWGDRRQIIDSAIREQRLAEDARAKSRHEKVVEYGDQVIGNRIFRRDPITGEMIQVRQLEDTRLEDRQSADLEQIIQDELRNASKEIPSRSINNIKMKAMARSISITPALESYINDSFASYAGDFKDYVSPAEETKLGQLGVVSSYAKRNLQLFHSLRPEQLVAFGPLQGKYNALLEKYKDDYKALPDAASRAQQMAFTETANSINDQGMRDLLLGIAAEYEVFARMQTGAAISESEVDSFNNLIGAAILEPPALQARLVGMINFTNQSRRSVQERALQARYGGNWDEGKKQVAKLDQYSTPPEDYMPFIGDQALAQMAAHPLSETLYPGAIEEANRRAAKER